MFDSLSEKIDKAIHRLSGRGRITDINIAEAIKDIRRALVDADVNYKIAKDFTDTIKARALGQDVIKAVEPGQVMIKIVRDEMSILMGETSHDISSDNGLNTILMAGLQGSGKTTFTAKLGFLLHQKKGKKVLLAACDVYRPAAIEQLNTLGKQIGLTVFSLPEEKNPITIASMAQKVAKDEGYDYLLVDTAGRLAIDNALMQEISSIHNALRPQETLFVVDSMTGQDAVTTAKTFHEALNYTGVVLTKLDGDTRGGAALSIRSVVKVPIKFIGTGEKMEAIDVFHPSRMADRILGMGDVISLVERAQESFDQDESRKLSKKIASNSFGFDDFLKQIGQIKKMGSVKDLMGMIPGVGKAMKNIDIPDDAFKHIEAMIKSMTPSERSNPSVLNGTRRARIAKGSGRTVADVNKLVKQFNDMSKMMKVMQGKGGQSKMMNMMKNNLR
jgi:signal recognition particle subunit SRP54|tara:strand:+ start:1180 stop:2514 length:1335 start_codon:yes stop_codon:yes gene_type:complete